MADVSRAEVSRRGILSVAAAASALAGMVKSSPRAAASPTGVSRATGTMVLDVEHLQAVGGHQRASAGEQHLVTGRLSTRSTPPESGVLFAHVTRSSRHDLWSTSASTVETHLLELPGGTIAGAGTVRHDGTGSFAITGGTGTYCGVQGSYSLQRSGGSRVTGAALITIDFLS